MAEIKAIETYYNGYRFRSRLEARWAVFFDALGIEYQYEPEGFKASNYEGEQFLYLPDFYLPEFHKYVEVKANKDFLYKDQDKISHCIDWESTPISASGLIVLGQIPYWEESRTLIPLFPLFEYQKGIISLNVTFLKNNKFGAVHLHTSPSYFYYSEAPKLPQICQDDNLYRLTDIISVWRYGIWFSAGPEDLKQTSSTLRLAYLAARQARFEHGEKPNL